MKRALLIAVFLPCFCFAEKSHEIQTASHAIVSVMAAPDLWEMALKADILSAPEHKDTIKPLFLSGWDDLSETARFFLQTEIQEIAGLESLAQDQSFYEESFRVWKNMETRFARLSPNDQKALLAAIASLEAAGSPLRYFSALKSRLERKQTLGQAQALDVPKDWTPHHGETEEAILQSAKRAEGNAVWDMAIKGKAFELSGAVTTPEAAKSSFLDQWAKLSPPAQQYVQKTVETWFTLPTNTEAQHLASVRETLKPHFETLRFADKLAIAEIESTLRSEGAQSRILP